MFLSCSLRSSTGIQTLMSFYPPDSCFQSSAAVTSQWFSPNVRFESYYSNLSRLVTFRIDWTSISYSPRCGFSFHTTESFFFFYRTVPLDVPAAPHLQYYTVSYPSHTGNVRQLPLTSSLHFVAIIRSQKIQIPHNGNDVCQSGVILAIMCSLRSSLFTNSASFYLNQVIATSSVWCRAPCIGSAGYQAKIFPL
jgi:hypothetical protein